MWLVCSYAASSIDQLDICTALSYHAKGMFPSRFPDMFQHIVRHLFAVETDIKLWYVRDKKIQVSRYDRKDKDIFLEKYKTGDTKYTLTTCTR